MLHIEMTSELNQADLPYNPMEIQTTLLNW